MKKKLKINELTVTSFVTSVELVTVRGGGSELCMTNMSCLPYVSCFEVQCQVQSRQEPCIVPAVRTDVISC